MKIQGTIQKIKIAPQILQAFFQKLSGSFTNKERLLVICAFGLLLAALAWYSIETYLKNTVVAPAYGGTFIEGIVGKPEYINPVLAASNETDLDLTKLIYSGIMKYDENNQLVNDVAESWSISEDKKEYTINLKQNVTFHDGEPLTAEDVLFTINTIQNSRFNSPLRLSWTSVEVKAPSEYQVVFTLKKPYTPFLHNLTFGILPKHIWSDVDAEEFQLSEFNKAPIGSGPYQFDRLEKGADKTIEQIVLKRNKNYYLQKPYIETILVKFFNSEAEALEALDKGNVMAINDLSHRNAEALDTNKDNLNEISLPRYYAIFLNIYENELIAEKSVREALAWATCPNEIVEKVLLGKGEETDSPILTISMEEDENFQKRGCSIDKAKQILEENGWKLKDYKPEEKEETAEENTETPAEATPAAEAATEEETANPAAPAQIYFNKSDEPLALTLTTADFPELIKTAEVIKQQWETAGVLVNLEVLSIGDLTTTKIEPRQYDALLFGETLGVDPDPRPYWHSSERKSPGQNIVGYNNSEADELLDKGREETNEDVRIQLYRRFQNLINEDIPAIFLYSPYYLYPTSKEVKGVNIKSIGQPSERFSNIENWYLEQQRIPAKQTDNNQ